MKYYTKPSVDMVDICSINNLLDSFYVYSDDPQKPGDALSNEENFWDEDVDEDYEDEFFD